MKRSFALQKDSAIRLQLFVVALIAVVAMGTFGFHTIEGWNLFDSLYMTVITLATVGFSEVHPLSQAGRAFTMVMIVLGAGVVTVAFTAIAQAIVQSQFNFFFERRKMSDLIRNLSDHTILCGFGRLSRIAAEQLRSSGKALVIIERDPDRAESARDLGYLVVTGDASLDDTLSQAGVMKAKHLASLLPKDSDNLYVILTSRELNPKLFILSRAEDEVGETRLRRAGADKILSPYRVGGQKIAEGLLRPYVTDFLDLAQSTGSNQMVIEEIRIPESSPYNGKTFREATFRRHANVLVAAIIYDAGESIFNPSADTLIQGGATFIALGPKDEMIKFEETILGK